MYFWKVVSILVFFRQFFFENFTCFKYIFVVWYNLIIIISKHLYFYLQQSIKIRSKEINKLLISNFLRIDRKAFVFLVISPAENTKATSVNLEGPCKRGFILGFSYTFEAHITFGRYSGSTVHAWADVRVCKMERGFIYVWQLGA